jgi:hypothetical protein
MLAHDVIVHGNAGERGTVKRRGRVAGRGGQAIAKHIGHDDEVLLQIESASDTHHGFGVGVLPAIERRHDNDIVTGGVHLPIGLVGQLDLRQGEPGLEPHVS